MMIYNSYSVEYLALDWVVGMRNHFSIVERFWMAHDERSAIEIDKYNTIVIA